jgi:hypothetical protein
LDEFWKFSAPFIIATLPILLHAIHFAVEKSASVSPVSHETLRELMRADHRAVVSAVGSDKASFDAVATYFNFERNCHFVIATMIFNIISLYFAQVEHTKHFDVFLWYIVLPMFLLFAVFGYGFAIRIANRRIDAASVNSMRRWVSAAIASFIFVLIVDCLLLFN